jgi:amino acid transporter
LFLTITGSAPISAMLFNVPIMVGFGQGVGAPAAFEFAAVVLVVFAVGYVAMARKKTTAGGFYSYISHGLGRELGIGTGYASVVAYSVFEASLAGGFAYFLNLKLNQFGVNIAWPWRPERSASACSSPSGPGWASRWRRTTARNPATPSGSSPAPCTSP